MNRFTVNLKQCPNCAARTGGLPHPSLGLLCAICFRPLPKPRAPKPNPKQTKKQKRRKAAARFNEPTRDYTRRERQEAVRDLQNIGQRPKFYDSHAGHPLGRGYPPGTPLRADGQSHREAWMEIVRGDPCSYCGARESGTVDHIIPKSRAKPGEAHTWANYAGACGRCNGSKSDTPLLMFLLRRRGLTHAGGSRTPAKDRRLAAERAGKVSVPDQERSAA